MTPPPPASANLIAKENLRKTARQLGRVTKAFFKSERRGKARFLCALLFALSIGSAGVAVLSNYMLRDVMTAIENKNPDVYWLAIGRYLGTFVLAVLLDVYFRWAEQSLALLWREWMAQHLIKRYFNNRAYYRLRGSDSIDNPDQRISEDVRNFTVDTLSYAMIALSSVMTLFGFLGVLWSISGALVSLAAVYATIGTVMCFVIGRRLVRLHYDKYSKEADFRYGLVRVRDNAESIAFYRGEKREHLDLIRRLAAVVANMRTIIVWNRNLGFFRNSYTYLALVLPLLIVVPMYMSGRIAFGVIAQTMDAFAKVLDAISIIANNFEGLSSYLAGVQRLGILWDDLDDFDADEERIAREREGRQHLDETSTQVSLDSLSVLIPGKAPKVLAKELSFQLGQNESLIIVGASGTGKSSILRTIAGLWPGGPGSLMRPAFNHLMFLPQRPYMVPGGLRDQLTYPDHDHGSGSVNPASDAEILRVIEKVNLTEILTRVDGDLDRVIDWTNVLSLGEQQRVAFARLFLRRPKFAFLDEATSALDEDAQNALYALIRASGIGFISVGHRLTLIPYHDRVLKLKKDGEWEIDDSSE